MTRLSQPLSMQSAGALTRLSHSGQHVPSSSVKFSGSADAVHMRFAGTSDTPSDKLTLKDIEAFLQEQHERVSQGNQVLLAALDMNLEHIQQALDSQEDPQLKPVLQAAKDCLEATKSTLEAIHQQHQRLIEKLHQFKTTVPDLEGLSPDEARPYLDQLFKELGAFTQGFPVDKVQQLVAQQQQQFKQLAACWAQVLGLIGEKPDDPKACEAQLEALKTQIEGIAQTTPASEEPSTPHSTDILTPLTFNWALKSIWDAILRDLRTKHFSDIPHDIREIWQKYKSSIPKAAFYDLGHIPPKPKQD